AILFDLIASYKDYAKVPSIVAYAATTALFFSLIEGRVSYLAFYFSGDVLNTGLSPYLVASLVLFLLAMICTLFAVICKQEKEEQYSFRTEDLKVVLPMAALVAVLCGVAVMNSKGIPTVEAPGSSASEPVEGSDVSQDAANYKSPSQEESVWQDYTPEDYLAEDVSAKTVVYQLTGEGKVGAGDQDVPFQAILNLYEDGESVLSVYGMDRASNYYGYWTNENDEYLWFCVTCYTMEGAAGVSTIDYSYDLTGHFDETTINIALGFADGGQFVRNIPISGDGSVQYASAEEFLTSLGWVPAAPVEVAPEPSQQPVSEGEPLFSFVSDSENYLLDFNADGTYTFTFVTAGLVETGEWSWENWSFTLTDANGKVTTAEMDEESHALN
ncbi:MAG: hypothetical protein K2K53_02960, partial [Oscillospiraceae bacterium]|nr:hypothetical protein [Oscillospiraceae bacterium]